MLNFKTRIAIAATTFLAACNQTDAPPTASVAALSAESPVTDTGAVTDCAIPYTVVRYRNETTSDLTDPRCTPGSASEGRCSIDLRTVLFIPSEKQLHHGNGSDDLRRDRQPLPAIVYNHGAEPFPGPKCAIAEYFVSQGYVVSVPHRRGHGRSTGVYIVNMPEEQWIDALHAQVSDVKDAFDHLKGLTHPNAPPGTPLVDPKKIAIMGHSFGGIMTTLTNATDLGHAAAINVCGASLSWPKMAFREMMFNAVDQARGPIFFLQPSNDAHTDPTIELGHRAGIAGKQYQSTIYPPVPDVSSPFEAHGQFVVRPSQMAIWGPGALDFMHRYGM